MQQSDPTSQDVKIPMDGPSIATRGISPTTASSPATFHLLTQRSNSPTTSSSILHMPSVMEDSVKQENPELSPISSQGSSANTNGHHRLLENDLHEGHSSKSDDVQFESDKRTIYKYVFTNLLIGIFSFYILIIWILKLPFSST